jgi:hypothetical protein
MPFIARPAAGQIIDPAWGTLVADAVVMRFTTAAQRTSQLTTPVPGQLTQLDTAPGSLDSWNGAAWVPATAGAELAYNQTTAPVSIVQPAFASSHLIVPGTARTYDGLPVTIEFYAPTAQAPNVAGGQLMFALADGVTDLGFLACIVGQAVAVPVRVTRRFTPPAGSHTYQVWCWAQVGGGATPGTVQAGPGGASTYSPAFVRITRA